MMSRPSWWYAPLLHSLKERKWNTVYIGAIESLSEKPKRQKMPNYVALLENPYICRLYRYRHENRKIMVEKPITKNITLDTSYIESNNFLAGNALNRLSELVKKHSIKLYLTDITYREIIARFNKRIESTKGTVKQIEKSAKKEFYILKNTVSMKPYFELPTIDIRVLEEEFISKSSVCRLIKKAIAGGYVRFKINYPVESVVSLEKEITPEVFAQLALEIARREDGA